MLEFANARLPLRREVNIEDVMEAALSRAAVPESVKVVRHLDGSVPPIPGDPEQLGQVFDNLIRNALQAMSPSCATEEGDKLVVESRVTGPDWVIISITDTGVGIPEENREKIFEPLFTTKARGIGLGLTISKNLVEAIGGRIEAESDGVPGRGSTLTVRLLVQGR